MLEINEIKELIQLIDNSGIQEFKIKQGDTSVSIIKNGKTTSQTTSIPVAPVAQVHEVVAAPVHPTPVQTEVPIIPAAKPVADNTFTITSPMVGTFYATQTPDAPAFVKPGDKVNKDTVVCIVEAMKLFNEIEADTEGTIVEVLVQHGQLVEYGQPLFVVQPEGGR
ncbi:acetyl-CoA carboxylase, biotin carboxyl carrier protein [Bacillus cereus]|uniref:Biotin carboxyl carrier protein of acetyl-CoA carboxylase n=2 Tax=Bacillus cereus group TaxID=86661 RepID=A0A9X6ZUZ8_BACTU|nr:MULTISPECIES: acetyl-CoA carboxylase biotin carboxyl carrier protein [Bacillus cereus group]PDZ94481.1 acetyl-CoA carboxylase, biotin carboxyl carrier protein [Bacillus cereus]PFJ42755.1 acetyl-CoA carboxylase, biotin carboxyl carrier protein [Bacillus thuringiensis]PGP21067.1 acetyl-CoA carboxylase, biotin carboxyl carrier protein [Bacillus cereus]